MKQYTVTGMSCAACSARVEKAVSKVDGVSACSVSLLTNSMGVEGDADSASVIRAVEEAGYGAALKEADRETGHNAESIREQEKALEDKETPKLKKRLFSSIGNPNEVFKLLKEKIDIKTYEKVIELYNLYKKEMN